MRVWLRVLLLKLSDLTPRATSFSIYAPHAPHANLTEVSDAALSGVYRWVASMKKPMMKYAFAPDLCEVLHPLISEAVSWSDWVPFLQPNFTRCDRLEHVLRTSFTIWQAASPALHFVDVTARCEAERLWAPIDQNHCTTSPWCLAVENQTQPHDKVANPEWVSWIEDQTPLELADPESDTCSHRTCWDCARADVVIGAFSQKRRLLGDQHARARVVRNGMLEMRPFGADGLPKPGGQLGRRGRTSEAATFLQFNADHAYMDNGTEVGKCWKIDSDLCDWLAASAVDGVDIKHSATVFFALVFSLAVCCCCYASCFCLGKLAYNLLSGYDLDDDGKLSFQELTYVLDEFIGDLCFTCTCPTVHDKKVSPLAGAITALETLQNLPVAAITFSVFTAIGVFILYSLELRMCLDCWDLAAAAHHEVGHLLSLDHPEGVADTAVSITRLNTTGIDFTPPPSPPPDIYGFLEWDADGMPPATPPPSPPPCPNPLPPPPPTATPTILVPAQLYLSLMTPWCAPLSPSIAPAFTLRHLNHPFGLAPPRHLLNKQAQAALDGSVMREFELYAGLSKDGPGRPRKCLSQDDLDGINFLYPACDESVFHGMPETPPCVYDTDWPYTAQRLLVEACYAAFFIWVALLALKLGSIVMLWLEQSVADRFVKMNARIMLAHGFSAASHGQNVLGAVLFRKRNQRLLQARMAIRLQAAARRQAAKKEVNEMARSRFQSTQMKALAAARLQAVVRGRKERENVGLPGSKKARMFAMRRQIEALNRKQEALMRPPGIRARDSGRGPLERTQSVRSEIG